MRLASTILNWWRNLLENLTSDLSIIRVRAQALGFILKSDLFQEIH